MIDQKEKELFTLARSCIDAAVSKAEHRLKQHAADPNEMMQAMKDARELYDEKASTRYSPAADGDGRLYKSEVARIFDDVKNER